MRNNLDHMTSRSSLVMTIRKSQLLMSIILSQHTVSWRSTPSAWKNSLKLREKRNCFRQKLLAFLIGCMNQLFLTSSPISVSLRATPSLRYSAFGKKMWDIEVFSRPDNVLSLMLSSPSQHSLKILWKSIVVCLICSKTRQFFPK